LVNSPKARYHAAKLQNEIIKWVVKGGAKRGAKKIVGDTIKKVVYTKPVPKVVKQKKIVKKKETPKYYLQLGSFKLRPSRAYIKRIEKMALPYHIKKNKVYKVFVGPYSKKETAQKTLKKVQARVSKHAFIKKM
jgi:cell division protein FtsN